MHGCYHDEAIVQLGCQYNDDAFTVVMTTVHGKILNENKRLMSKNFLEGHALTHHFDSMAKIVGSRSSFLSSHIYLILEKCLISILR